MSELLHTLVWPTLVVGLIAGGAGTYLLGARDPFIIAAAAVAGAILGLLLDLRWSTGTRRRRKVG